MPRHASDPTPFRKGKPYDSEPTPRSNAALRRPGFVDQRWRCLGRVPWIVREGTRDTAPPQPPPVRSSEDGRCRPVRNTCLSRLVVSHRRLRPNPRCSARGKSRRSWMFHTSVQAMQRRYTKRSVTVALFSACASHLGHRCGPNRVRMATSDTSLRRGRMGCQRAARRAGTALANKPHFTAFDAVQRHKVLGQRGDRGRRCTALRAVNRSTLRGAVIDAARRLRNDTLNHPATVLAGGDFRRHGSGHSIARRVSATDAGSARWAGEWCIATSPCALKAYRSRGAAGLRHTASLHSSGPAGCQAYRRVVLSDACVRLRLAFDSTSSFHYSHSSCSASYPLA